MHRTTLSGPRFWRVAVSTVVVLAGAGLFLPSLARAQEAKHIHTTNRFVDFPAKVAEVQEGFPQRHPQLCLDEPGCP